jgi:hypothetical protein
MIPIDVTCPHCERTETYRPSDYVGEYLLCRDCGRIVPVEVFFPQASPRARLEMWQDDTMRPYLRNAGFPDER